MDGCSIPALLLFILIHPLNEDLVHAGNDLDHGMDDGIPHEMGEQVIGRLSRAELCPYPAVTLVSGGTDNFESVMADVLHMPSEIAERHLKRIAFVGLLHISN